MNTIDAAVHNDVSGLLVRSREFSRQILSDMMRARRICMERGSLKRSTGFLEAGRERAEQLVKLLGRCVLLRSSVGAQAVSHTVEETLMLVEQGLVVERETRELFNRTYRPEAA